MKSQDELFINVEPVRNNLLLRYKFEAKGIVIINEKQVRELEPTEKIIIKVGNTAEPHWQPGVNVITKFNCFSLQPTIIRGNKQSVNEMIKKLNSKNILNTPVKSNKIISSVNVTTTSEIESAKADAQIAMNSIHIMYEYYLINEGDLLAIDLKDPSITE